MIKYVLKKNTNKESLAFGKWYAFPVVEETIDLAGLALHMEEHNTGFSEALCLGLMTAMVKCIKEQLLAGKNVKIDNLAIFSVGIRNKKGAESEAEFSVANNIAGVKLRARATGTLSNSNLNSSASMKKATSVVGGSSTSGSTDGDDDTPSGDGGSTSGGDSTSGGSGSSTTPSGGSSSSESESGDGEY